MNEKKIAVELRGLTKKFGNFVVVNSVDLEVSPGEFVFLLGPSGSGKTTTLRMIGGYEQPTEGVIKVAGKDVTDLPIHKRDIGMVFQNYALFPHKTVLENVEFGLRMRSEYAKKERLELAEQALALVELSGLEMRYPRQLSGGQQQRVALARVIAYCPSLVLLDEPLANLDRRLRDSMRVELKKLQKKLGIASIFVTHDQEEALTMADRVAVMDNGRLMQVATPSEIYNRPCNSFVATFLGESNLYNGRITEVREDYSKVLAEGMGQEVEVCTGKGFAVGKGIGICLRPERIHVFGEGEFHGGTESDSMSNTFLGTVEFVTYLGHSVLYLVRLEGGAILKASHPISTDRIELGANTRVYASWDAHSCICVDC